LYSFVVLYETNILNLINQCLNKYYLIKTKVLQSSTLIQDAPIRTCKRDQSTVPGRGPAHRIDWLMMMPWGPGLWNGILVGVAASFLESVTLLYPYVKHSSSCPAVRVCRTPARRPGPQPAYGVPPAATICRGQPAVRRLGDRPLGTLAGPLNNNNDNTNNYWSCCVDKPVEKHCWLICRERKILF
jgi:hypothetical protein